MGVHNTPARMADMAKTMSFELASPHQRAELVIHLEAFLAEPPRLDGSRPESVIYLRKCQEEVLTLSPPPHTHHTPHSHRDSASNGPKVEAA